MLQLHTHPLSTFGRRVEIAVLEKGLEVERVQVDMAQRAHRQASYLALHPYARVPTLVDGDFVLPESTPILEYLEAIHPEPALVPGDARGRALVALHMKLCDLELTPWARQIIFPKRFLAPEKWRVDEMATAKVAVERHLGILEAQLAGKTYLVAERYTLAEVCYVPFVHFIPLMEVAPPPNVAAWVERILERPSSRLTASAF